MTDIRDNLFGLLAVRGHFVTNDQVYEALKLQQQYEESGKGVPRMGELLAHLGYMTPAQIRAVLQGQGPQARGLFGEIGIHWQIFAQEDVDSALAHQRELKSEGELPMRIGQIMVSRGIIKPHQIKAILQAQGKNIVQCPSCSVRYNAIRIKAGDRVQCPRCSEQFTPIPADEQLEMSEPEFTPEPDQLPGIREDLQADVTVEMPAVKATPPSAGTDSARSTVGPYEIIEALGSDYSGTLYKAYHPQSKDVVVIRLFSNEILAGSEDLDRWKMAGQAATALEHPNLQRIISMSSDQDRAYLVMDFIEGESLRQQVEQRSKLPKAEVLEILIQAADALSYGHARDLIHGNLRPCHMIMGFDRRIRLTGLGTPKKIHKDLQLIARGAGTSSVPLYAPPEILIDEKDADERTDIYNLAAIGYHLVTGKAPQAGSDLIHAGFKTALEDILPPNALVSDLEPYLSRLLLKALRPNPGDRYESMELFLVDLRKCRAGILANLQNLPEIAPEEPQGRSRIKKGSRPNYKPRRNFRTHKGKGRKSGPGRSRRGSAYSSAARASVPPEPKLYAPEPEPIVKQELGLQEVLFDAPMEPIDATKEMVDMVENPPEDAVFVPKFSRPLPKRRKQMDEDPPEAHRSQLDAKSVGPDNRNSKRIKSRKKRREREEPPQGVSKLAVFGIVACFLALIGGIAFLIMDIGQTPFTTEATEEQVDVEEMDSPKEKDIDGETSLVSDTNDKSPEASSSKAGKAEKEFGQLLVFSAGNDHKTVIAKLDTYLEEFGSLQPVPSCVETAQILRVTHARKGAEASLPELRTEIERLGNAGRVSQASVLLDQWTTRWGQKATQEFAFDLKNSIESKKGTRVSTPKDLDVIQKQPELKPIPENDPKTTTTDKTKPEGVTPEGAAPKDPADIDAEKANDPLGSKGWHVAEGQWSMEGGVMTGSPEKGQFARLERPFKLVKSVSVRVRGYASAVGFSFGQGKEFLLRPSAEWQTLTLHFNASGPPVLELNGEARSALEDVSEVTAASLGKKIALVSLGKAEFEGFKAE